MVEIGGIIILGIFAQWIAWRLKVPAILPLLIIGLLVGPAAEYFNGYKLLDPMWNNDLHQGLFPGEHLFHFVELAIGIILFEGGLTLKREELKGVGDSIVKLISIGALVTFIGAGVSAHYIIGLSWPLSFLFSGLIIVTGPTVIAPILRNVPLKNTVSSVLKWEGILIDPIGALAAVLMYEFITTTHGSGHFTLEALQHFLMIAAWGTFYGVIMAFTLRYLLKKHLIPHFLITIFSLAFVLFIFVTSSIVLADSGLLTVVVAGMVLGNIDVPYIKDITYFKESLSILLISILFILLSANIDLADLQLLLNWKCAALLAVVILVLRPLSVFISTYKSTLSTKEKLFISWVGPRGIVAAGIASLFGMKLVVEGYDGANYITPLVFMVVLGTVLLNATTARLMAKMLGVMLEKSNGILIVGAHKASRLIAKWLKENGQNVALIDNNKMNISYAKKAGLQGFVANIYSDDLKDNLTLSSMGSLIALTGSTDINNYSLEKYGEQYGENGVYRLPSSMEIKNPDAPIPENALFSDQHDYISLIEVARDYPQIHEIPVSDINEYHTVINALGENKQNLPLLLKHDESNIQWITIGHDEPKITQESQLVYFGKKLDKSPIVKKEVDTDNIDIIEEISDHVD